VVVEDEYYTEGSPNIRLCYTLDVVAEDFSAVAEGVSPGAFLITTRGSMAFAQGSSTEQSLPLTFQPLVGMRLASGSGRSHLWMNATMRGDCC